MSRSVKEWVGKTDDEDPPPRVKLRVLHRFCSKCAECKRFIYPGAKWVCDHIIALINGGENREKNLQPLCEFCEPDKTRADVAEKSKTATIQKKAYGLHKPKTRPMDGSKASRWKKPINGPAMLRAGS